MLRFQPNWFARILRNTAEIVGDTVVIHEPAQIVEVPADPTMGATLDAAAQVIGMAHSVADMNAPADRTGEMIALLSEIRDDMRALRNQPATPAIVEVVVPDEPDEPDEPDTSVVVQTGDDALVKEDIDPVDTTQNEPPKQRKRRLI